LTVNQKMKDDERWERGGGGCCFAAAAAIGMLQRRVGEEVERFQFCSAWAAQ
jgi:hypothetical protein